MELTPPAIEALQDQMQFTQGQEHVFHNPRTNKPWNNSDRVKRFWDRIIKRAGVEYRIPYTTRHTFASLMLSSGVNPMWVARQMGHKDWGMIRKTYGRWLPDVDTSVQDKIQGICHTRATALNQVLERHANLKDSNPVTPTKLINKLRYIPRFL
jgi:integrase